MRAAWLAVLLAGCAAAVPHASRPAAARTRRPPRCGHILGSGERVSSAQLGAIHFLSPQLGLGLTVSQVPCGSSFRSTPALLAVTRDGGRHWLAEGTTNGGGDWTVQPVPGQLAALSITRKTLWALGCPHTINVWCRPLLARKRMMGGRWRISRPRWLGRPCNGFGLTSSDPADWWIICLGDAAAGSSTKALLRTTDGGRTWTVASQVTSLIAPPRPGSISRAEPNALAAGSRTRLWLAFQNSLSESDDAGVTWTDVPGVSPQGQPAAFDVLSPTRAWLLAAGHGLWRTTDGRHWRAL